VGGNNQGNTKYPAKVTFFDPIQRAKSHGLNNRSIDRRHPHQVAATVIAIDTRRSHSRLLAIRTDCLPSNFHEAFASTMISLYLINPRGWAMKALRMIFLGPPESVVCPTLTRNAMDFRQK